VLLGGVVEPAGCFTAPAFATFTALVAGLVTNTARGTVTGMLTAAGLARTWPHDRAHAFFSRQKNLYAIDEAMAAPAILRPALQEKGGWQRLHRFAAVAAHATIWAAEDALGLKQSVLTHQIKRLEHDLGGQLLIRARRGRPMKLTPFGAEVVSAIARVKP